MPTRTMLVVDDDAALLAIVAEALGEDGFDVQSG
jgi:hypothetical protein